MFFPHSLQERRDHPPHRGRVLERQPAGGGGAAAAEPAGGGLLNQDRDHEGAGDAGQVDRPGAR